MSAAPSPLGIDPGLLGRFRTAGAAITWKPADAPKGSRAKRRSARVAHLNDEEARVEERREGTAQVLTVDSGPVGALVLILRWADGGTPSRLLTHEAGELAAFPSGAIEARWESPAATPQLALRLADLVALARYALA
ncbi:MAG: hypothetical protein L3K18_04570 [Thermoplasmata archaeon]|nr:hypothetical protein [Thermoplasmata archaeon]MCI4356400.1 hypothetical protein [Thermoplasmata archaeon]